MDHRKLYGTLIGVLTFIALITGAAFAYWSWSSTTAQKTNITFTIASGFTCSADGGGDITSNDVELAPASCTNSTYAIQRPVVVSTTQDAGKTIYLDMWLHVNSISANLAATSNFKYALTTSSSGCDQGTVVSQGNFSGAAANSEYKLLNGKQYQSSTTNDTYYLYIWLDAAETDNATQNGTFSFSLGGQCTDQEPYPYLYNVLADAAVSGTGVNFAQTSIDNGTNGVYRLESTASDAHPVYFYRGNVTNNNVLFAGFCWKIVRTTSTGGTKLIYNGTPGNVITEEFTDADTYISDNEIDTFTFDSSDNTWNISITDNNLKDISFKVPAGDNYNFVMTGTTGSSAGGSYYIYKDGIQAYVNGGGGGQALSYTHNFGTLTASNVIKFSYSGTSSSDSPITFKIKMQQNGNDLIKNDYTMLTRKESDIVGCVNTTGAATELSSSSTFNSSSNLPAYVGYMHDGATYTNSYATGTGWKYAPDVSYDNGMYTLIDKGTYVVETKNTISGTNLNYHHYTCGNATDTTCATVKYVYFVSGSTAYYINLTNNKKVSNALNDMLTNTGNTQSSTIKTAIDNWYVANMTSYTNMLEDTIWCNDRSIYQLNGWNPDGGSATANLYFGSYGRMKSTHAPIVTCPSKNDAFTVTESSTGNGKLTYPIGLLTVDEINMAGGLSGSINSSYYLYTYQNYWALSPSFFDYYFDYEWRVSPSGYISDSYGHIADGVRPSVSLKPGTVLSGGDGTGNNPYTVR